MVGLEVPVVGIVKVGAAVDVIGDVVVVVAGSPEVPVGAAVDVIGGVVVVVGVMGFEVVVVVVRRGGTSVVDRGGAAVVVVVVLAASEVGGAVGKSVGKSVGKLVGKSVGKSVGKFVGMSVGNPVGASVTKLCDTWCNCKPHNSTNVASLVDCMIRSISARANVDKSSLLVNVKFTWY